MDPATQRKWGGRNTFINGLCLRKRVSSKQLYRFSTKIGTPLTPPWIWLWWVAYPDHINSDGQGATGGRVAPPPENVFNNSLQKLGQCRQHPFCKKMTGKLLLKMACELKLKKTFELGLEPIFWFLAVSRIREYICFNANNEKLIITSIWLRFDCHNCVIMTATFLYDITQCTAVITLRRIYNSTNTGLKKVVLGACLKAKYLG